MRERRVLCFMSTVVGLCWIVDRLSFLCHRQSILLNIHPPEKKDGAMMGFNEKNHAPASDGHASSFHETDVDGASETEISSPDPAMIATVATVGIVGAGVVLVEAALLPGLMLGVAAMTAPKYLPQIGSALNPIFKSAVRGTYLFGQKTKEFVAETKEQFEDIAAEMASEDSHSSNDSTQSQGNNV